LDTGRKEKLIVGAMLYRIKIAKRRYMFYGVYDFVTILSQALGVY
jgi:hypothetical protein